MKTRLRFRPSTLRLPWRRRIISGVAASMIGVWLPAIARAQGCAMCYTSASAAKKVGMEALQNGVLVLLFPPLVMFAAILWQAFRRHSMTEMEPVQVPDNSLAGTPDR